jgi:hypothetical protein
MADGQGTFGGGSLRWSVKHAGGSPVSGRDPVNTTGKYFRVDVKDPSSVETHGGIVTVMVPIRKDADQIKVKWALESGRTGKKKNKKKKR